MEASQEILAGMGVILGYVGVGILCLAGIVLSCVTISGTWLILAAAVLSMFLTGHSFPGWWVILLLALICIVVEVIEAVAGYCGVVKRGGSRWAGVAGLVGGLAGLILGSMVLPIIGSILGMLAGSFVLAFLVEKRRLKESDRAAGIALGGVVARVLVLLMKVVVTLGMCTYLGVGLVFYD